MKHVAFSLEYFSSYPPSPYCPLFSASPPPPRSWAFYFCPPPWHSHLDAVRRGLGPRVPCGLLSCGDGHRHLPAVRRLLLTRAFQTLRGSSSLAPPPGRKQDGAAGRGLWNLGSVARAGEKAGASPPQPTTCRSPTGSADPCGPQL